MYTSTLCSFIRSRSCDNRLEVSTVSMSMARKCDENEKERIEAVVEIGDWTRFRKTLLSREINWRMKNAYAVRDTRSQEGVTRSWIPDGSRILRVRLTGIESRTRSNSLLHDRMSTNFPIQKGGSNFSGQCRLRTILQSLSTAPFLSPSSYFCDGRRHDFPHSALAPAEWVVMVYSCLPCTVVGQKEYLQFLE